MFKTMEEKIEFADRVNLCDYDRQMLYNTEWIKIENDEMKNDEIMKSEKIIRWCKNAQLHLSATMNLNDSYSYKEWKKFNRMLENQIFRMEERIEELHFEEYTTKLKKEIN